MKKIICFLVCGLLLVGCGKSKDTPLSKYDGLDAKETYTTLVSKMNKEVDYVNVYESSKTDATKIESDWYRVDGEANITRKLVYDVEGTTMFEYSIYTPTTLYVLFDDDNDDLYDLTQTPIKENNVEFLTNLYEVDGTKVKSIKKKEKEDSILITMQYLQTTAGIENNNEAIIEIGENGLVKSITNNIYEDNTFAGKPLYTSKAVFQEYNTKKVEVFEKALKQIKKLDQKRTKEVKETLLGD